MGVKVIRNSAEERDAAIVLTNTGQFKVASRAKIPALAAVSPKRETGAWILKVDSCMFGSAVLLSHDVTHTYRAGPKPA